MSKYAKYKLQNSQEALPSKYAKYRVTPEPQQSPSFLERAAQFGKGALSGFGRSALEEAAKQAEYGVMDVDGMAVPIAESAALAKIPEKGIESLESMRPKKDDSLGNILYHAGEFGGGVASFPMLPGRVTGATGVKSLFSRFGRDIGTGSAIGAGSGVLQEGGVNPLAADVVSGVLLPSTNAGISKMTKGTKNLLSRFTPTVKKEMLNAEVGDILKHRIGEKNIPAVLGRLNNKGPLNTNLTTAELAQNAGLAGLHRAMSPNIPAISEKNLMNNHLIRESLESLGNINLTPEMVGENIREPLAKNLKRAVEERAVITAPLYEKVNQLTEKVNLPKTRSFLEKEGKYAKGDIKKNLNYIEDIIRSNNSPKNELSSINKLYGNLGPQALSQLKQEALGGPLPIELTNALKDISGRIGSAKKAGNHEVARVLSLAKENILADMATIPEEQVARSAYAQLSKPVSAIEKDPLLSKFVKKDEFGKDFLLSPEKIPDMILNSPLNSTKALIKQIGNNQNSLSVLRGNIVNKVLNSTELSNGERNLSYDKMNKFLKKNKAKLNLIFEPEQVKVFEDVNEILKKRNMVATLGRATGSNTQSETTLLNSLFDIAGNKVLREAAAYKIPGGGRIYDVTKDFFKKHQTQATKELLEKALLDPEVAKLLLTPSNKIKDPQTLQEILTRIYSPNVMSPILNNLSINREA